MDSNPVMRRLYELDDVPLPPTKDIEMDSCSQFWMYRQPVTLDDFKLKVQVNAANRNAGKLQVLWKFLQQVHISTLCQNNKLFFIEKIL